MGARAAGRSRFLPWTLNSQDLIILRMPWGSLWNSSIQILQSLMFLSVTLSRSAEILHCFLGPATNQTLKSQGLGGAQKSSQRIINLFCPGHLPQDELNHLSEVLLYLDKISKDHTVPLVLPKYPHVTTSVQSMGQDQRMPQGKDHSNQLLLTLSLCKMVPSTFKTCWA